MSADNGKKYIARVSRGSSTNTNNNINTRGGRVYASILYTEQFLETETAPLCVRVPLKYKIIYKSMNTRQKQMLKLGIVALIEAIARGEGEAAQHSPVIVNVNINYNEVKPRQEVRIELDELEEVIAYLRKLEQHNGTLYPQAIRKLRRRLEAIRKSFGMCLQAY